MIKWSNIYEGDFCHGYTCLTCDKIMEMFPDDEGYPERYVLEIMLDYGEKSPDDLLEVLKKRRKESCPNNNPSS